MPSIAPPRYCRHTDVIKTTSFVFVRSLLWLVQVALPGIMVQKVATSQYFVVT